MLNRVKLLFIVASISFCPILTTSIDGAYVKKSAYEGYGKVSQKTGKIKTTKVSGYKKQDGSYVNPYAKS